MPSLKDGIIDRKLSALLDTKKYKRTSSINFVECSSMIVKQSCQSSLIQENREKEETVLNSTPKHLDVIKMMCM